MRSAQKIVDVLSAQGVRYVFGVPGAKIDAVYDALIDGGPELVVCRHEQNAAFMAAAVGRLTGTPGVVVVTSGPGTTNLATGLLTANTEQDPVVALCGAVQRQDRLKRTHQSMDAAAMLRTVTKFTGEIAIRTMRPRPPFRHSARLWPNRVAPPRSSCPPMCWPPRPPRASPRHCPSPRWRRHRPPWWREQPN